MAEVLATMVVRPLVSMVKDKASSYLLDQYKVMEGMEEQHELLKRKLPAILDVITDAEEQAAKHREGAKAWLEAVRKVAYKANDVLDEFKYEALRRKARKERHYKELGMDVIKLFPSHNRFVFRYRMANKLRVILQELDVLVAEMNIFRFRFKQQPPMSLKCRQTDPQISDHSVNIANESRAKEKMEIVGTLLGQKDNPALTVLPIFGMGGMGKTTLAQLVYDDSAIQKDFQVRFWVCVAENFDVDFLAKRIVEAAEKDDCKVGGSTEKDDCKVEGGSTFDKLKNAVTGKRYLLVLDDVWNREPNKWEKLKSYLDHGGKGSSVLTTTRDEYIAGFMVTKIEPYKIKGLDEKFIKKIIKTAAFGLQEKAPAELHRMVGPVAKRCSGSPLAATAIGSVLHTKSTVQEWEAVLSKSTIYDEENEILPVLKLSYNCLPPHMRQCFAFCAMFPKDYEIDVEMLIQLWMANCFIPEQQGVCLEFTGRQIFNELAQRSFFQEVKQVTFGRVTCKIHDLMHDVAQDAMGKECATMDTELSQSEVFPFSARHLFLSVYILETALNASLEKGSSAIQTLISVEENELHLSKYSSVRALKIQRGSFLELKYLHHLRYLDLSDSDIEALPEDITILYHLQTLNVAYCSSLRRLPKAMKYMTALRHLYTHGCPSLESMPTKLGHLTSLQTLTCFVAGHTVSGCSNVGELGKLLDLGGQLELRQLENVATAEARAASLGNKKKLEELTLTWTYGHGSDANRAVLEGLKPHDGLKAMRIISYGGSTIPSWILELQGMVKLELLYCSNVEKLPALWQLPALQFLTLKYLGNLHCLFSGGSPSEFQKLKSMALDGMPMFETWWDTDEVQGEEPIFPEVEELTIRGCRRLRALPKAAEAIKGCRSAFPALRKMTLYNLEMLHRWEEACQESSMLLGGDEQQVTFPRLEELEIRNCPKLSTYPEAPKLSKLVVCVRSDKTSLLEAASRRYITSRSKLDFYEARDDTGTQILQRRAWRDILSCAVRYGAPTVQSLLQLPRRVKKRSQNWITWIGLLARDKEEEWNHVSLPLTDLYISQCSEIFSGSRAMSLWTSFQQLVNLTITECGDLVYWPEKVFQGLVSLTTLNIEKCTNLTGQTEEEASGEQTSGPDKRSGRLPPRLESLEILICESLVKVPNLPPSLKTLDIRACHGLKSLVFIGGHQQQQKQEEETGRLVMSGEGGVRRPDASSSLISAAAAAGSSSSPPGNHRFFLPCLETLTIGECTGLSEVANLPPSIKTLQIYGCDKLGSLSSSSSSSGDELPLLEDLYVYECKSLVEFPKVLPSLEILCIHNCEDLKGSIVFLSQQQQEQTIIGLGLAGGEGVVILDTTTTMSSSIIATAAAGSSSSPSSSTAPVHNLSPSAPNNLIRLFVPCLEDLRISGCPGLSEVANLPPSIKTLGIFRCNNLGSLSPSGGVPSSLEELRIYYCRRLASLPSGPHQEAYYSSLRVVVIKGCPGIKQLPPSLQQHLDYLDKKDLDPHLVGGSTMTRLMRKLVVPSRLSCTSKVPCFTSKSEED